MNYMLAPSILAFAVVYITRFLLVMRCDDWLIVWVGLEINMVRFVLIIFKRGDIIKRESAMKYFFIQGIGSALFIRIFYLDREILRNISPFILRYKMGGGPFYFWFPSLCERISWGICLILMTLQKIIPLILMGRIIGVVVWWVGVRRIIIGGVGILNQVKFKRLFAFSSIFHVGLVILGILILEKIWFIYILIYIFIIMCVVERVWGIEVEFIGQMFRNKINWVFIVRILNIAGIPPLLGFFLKWMIFYWLVGEGVLMLTLLVLISVLMFYIYIRVVYDLVVGMRGLILNFEEEGRVKGEIIRMFGVIIGPVGIYLLM